MALRTEPVSLQYAGFTENKRGSIAGRGVLNSALEFEIEIPATGPFNVELSGGAATALPVHGVAPGDFVTLELVPSATVFGKVVDEESGAPVEGAVVRVLEEDSPRSMVEVRTERDGTYRASGLVAGWGGVVAYAPGFEMRQYTEIETRPLEELRHDIALQPGRRLSGAVLDLSLIHI